MGIFQSRPEEPTEWAGLPAEPWEPRAPGEMLPPSPVHPDDPAVGSSSSSGADASVVSVSVPVPTSLLAPPAAAEDTSDDATGAGGSGERD